jgi:hypothetical protein
MFSRNNSQEEKEIARKQHKQPSLLTKELSRLEPKMEQG